MTCIDCHKGIAHKNVRDQLTDEELEELEKPDPAFQREVPQLYLDGLKLVEQQEKEAAEKEAAEKAKLKEKKKRAKEETQKRIDKAVEEAVDKAVKAALASAAAAAPAVAAATSDTPPVEAAPAAAEAVPAEAAAQPATGATSADSNVDWSNAPAREITLFYPGQSSMEWMLTGKDHGGARPFTKLGDRCFTCHDKEADKMGQKIVTGEKLEPEATLIPDKRGSIPVAVQAMHDDENLYMRFEWENSEHTPAPFVDGGKMDPDNPMKLAIMFATDDVKYASQAGCWGTCHHDLDSMPDNPGEKVTKYITESRSKVEIKGRRGKKRGGWDKRKDDAGIQSEMDQGHFMDLLRYKSGKSESEDGDILADRVMEGGHGSEFKASLNGDTWVVEMKRKLKSDKPGDISMTLDKIYNFGFAIHDDYTNTRFHHVSLGYLLGFDNDSDKVEVNAVKR